MKSFKVQVLGCDNGSGEFERGGDLDMTVGVSNVTFDLPVAIAKMLYEQDNNRNFGRDRAAGTVGLYDERTQKLGEHLLVCFSINEQGAGEQNFAFIATEVK